jgi:hypothetical protein
VNKEGVEIRGNTYQWIQGCLEMLKVMMLDIVVIVSVHIMIIIWQR